MAVALVGWIRQRAQPQAAARNELPQRIQMGQLHLFSCLAATDGSPRSTWGLPNPRQTLGFAHPRLPSDAALQLGILGLGIVQGWRVVVLSPPMSLLGRLLITTGPRQTRRTPVRMIENRIRTDSSRSRRTTILMALAKNQWVHPASVVNQQILR